MMYHLLFSVWIPPAVYIHLSRLIHYEILDEYFLVIVGFVILKYMRKAPHKLLPGNGQSTQKRAVVLDHASPELDQQTSPDKRYAGEAKGAGPLFFLFRLLYLFRLVIMSPKAPPLSGSDKEESKSRLRLRAGATPGIVKPRAMIEE